MIQFQFFPRSNGISIEAQVIVRCFEIESDNIDSEKYNLSSNEVLGILKPHLDKVGFICETGKSKENKIIVPVLFGYNNVVDKSFNADAISSDGKIVIEIEAGRATENNQFLKDVFRPA